MIIQHSDEGTFALYFRKETLTQEGLHYFSAL